MKKPFRKLILLSHERTKMDLVDRLQELGVVHLEMKKDNDAKVLEKAMGHYNTIKDILLTLGNSTSPNEIKNVEQLSINVLKEEIISIKSHINDTKQDIEALQKEHDKLSSWGNFHKIKFKTIQNRGFNVFLCTTTRKVFQSLDLKEIPYQVISEDKRDVYFAVITKSQAPDLPVEFFPLPERTPMELRKIISSKKRKLEALHSNLNKYYPYIPDLQVALQDAGDEIKRVEARQSFTALSNGHVSFLTGWLPEDKVGQVKEFLNHHKFTYFLRDPGPDDDVPVVLKNSPYSKLYEPITKIFELPNYYETDLTPFIAVFYPILFAYCLGDAGYGFLLAAGSMIGYLTFLNDQKRVAILGFILGAVTMVMGLVKSGSLFGIMLISDHDASWIRFLSQLVLIPDDSDFVFNAFNVALMIGVIQIITGILLSIYNSYRYEGMIYALSPLGKLLIVISLIWVFLAEMQEVAALMRYEGLRTTMLIIGISLVALFHDPDRSVFKRLAGSAMPLFFIFTGILGDILSYVRLFALGLASSVLGLVVNQIGEQIMSGGILALLLGILFLIFGHSLNFFIAALGSFVHPLRLTFVEFYGNATFKGKGIAYEPFKKSLSSINNT